MTLRLYIAKANTPGVPPEPATVPDQTPKSGPGKPSGTGIQYDYWDGPGAPPPEQGWEAYQKRDGGSGYRKPKGTGGAAAPKSEASQGKDGAKTEADPYAGMTSDVPPADPPPPPKPEDVSDPLKNDDGTKVGEAPLEVSETDLGHESTQATMRDAKQTTLDNGSQFAGQGEDPNVPIDEKRHWEEMKAEEAAQRQKKVEHNQKRITNRLSGKEDIGEFQEDKRPLAVRDAEKDSPPPKKEVKPKEKPKKDKKNSATKIKEAQKYQKDAEDAKAEYAKAQEEFKKFKSKIKGNKDSTRSAVVRGQQKKVDEAKKKYEDAKKKADEHKNTANLRIPSEPHEKIQHQMHQEAAKKKLDIIDAHLKNDPESKDLQALREVYAEQADLEHMPEQNSRSAMRAADAMAKDRGVDRHPDEIAEEKAQEEAKAKEKADKEAAQVAKEAAKADAEKNAQAKRVKDDEAKGIRKEKPGKRRGSSLMTNYNRGTSVGNTIGAIGEQGGGHALLEGTAALPRAGVRAGQYIANESNNEKQAEEENPQQKSKAKEVGKGMKLYIDLKKAGGTVTAAKDSDKDEDENEQDYETSFKRRTAGVSGNASPDTPGPGRKINEKHKVNKSLYISLGGAR